MRFARGKKEHRIAALIKPNGKAPVLGDKLGTVYAAITQRMFANESIPQYSVEFTTK